jgi:uncharacterized protein (DUF2461 family)
MSNQPPFAGFPKETLQYLKDLAANNNREWFKAHEDGYHRFLLTPAQDFVIALGERMKTISKGQLRYANQWDWFYHAHLS